MRKGAQSGATGTLYYFTLKPKFWSVVQVVNTGEIRQNPNPVVDDFIVD